MTAPQVVDWFAVLLDIARHLDNAGQVDCPHVAARVGVRLQTLRAWTDGAEPRHSDGEQVLAVWAECMDRPISSVPRINRPLTASQMR